MPFAHPLATMASLLGCAKARQPARWFSWCEGEGSGRPVKAGLIYRSPGSGAWPIWMHRAEQLAREPGRVRVTPGDQRSVNDLSKRGISCRILSVPVSFPGN
jgi:hypothetical protein